MAVADFLKDVGEGVKTGAKALGSAVEPVLARTAEVVSGEAPQIDQEKRQQQEKLEDEQIAVKASALENQLAMGQKYGTLTPEQQKQYVDQITGLYSHPRHMGTLMEKLRKVTHPNGAYNTGPLPNATPPGGTAAVDEATRERALADTLGMRQTAQDEEIDRRAQDALKYRKPPNGKTPPVPGNQLPPDAAGPDGQPIPATARTAGQSYVDYGGVWYAAPKPKPVYKVIKGHTVLMDPTTGNPLRDLGPSTGVKVTSSQFSYLGDDGQMHLGTKHSVTTPQNETIDVEMSPDSPEATAPTAPNETPKTPAKKIDPGSLLPKTGAKPVAAGVSTPVIPGSHAWANTKDPVIKSQTAQWTKAAEDARSKKQAYENASGLLADNTRQTDLELVYAWVRANVQGAGRMTNTEIQQTATAGSFGERVKNQISQAATGRLAPELEKQFMDDIKRSYDNSQKEADDLLKSIQNPGGQTPQSPATPPADDPLNLFPKK